MREMGIMARLDEVVSAPPVIKHLLNGQAVLDQSVNTQTPSCFVSLDNLQVMYSLR